jgi:hypothetical protein
MKITETSTAIVSTTGHARISIKYFRKSTDKICGHKNKQTTKQTDITLISEYVIPTQVSQYKP